MELDGGKKYGVVMDFSESSYQALDWAQEHLILEKRDVLYIIHVADMNLGFDAYPVCFNFKEFQSINRRFPLLNWPPRFESRLHRKVFDKATVCAMIYEGRESTEKLLDASKHLNCLVVGRERQAGRNGGSNTRAEVCDWLVRNIQDCSVTVVTEK